MGLDMYLTISEYVSRTTRNELRPDSPKANPVFEQLVNRRPSWVDKGAYQGISAVSYTHLTQPTTPYV